MELEQQIKALLQQMGLGEWGLVSYASNTTVGSSDGLIPAKPVQGELKVVVSNGKGLQREMVIRADPEASKDRPGYPWVVKEPPKDVPSSATPDKTAPSSAQFLPDGVTRNPNYQPPAGQNTRPPEPNVSTTAPKIPVWDAAKGEYVWQDNPNYKPAKPESNVRVVGDSLVDDSGKVIYTKPKEAKYFQTADAILEIDANGNSRTIWSKADKPTVLNTGNTPNIALQSADGTITSQKNPAYTAAAQQILQNQYDTIAYIKGQMEQGTMSPAEASSYMDALRQQTDAALKGTTPYQVAKDAEQSRLDKAQLGRDVLTTRVGQSRGLAEKLIDTIKPTGVTGFDFSKVDPFGFANSYVDDRMGGPQTGALASQLLQGINSAPAPQAPQMPGVLPTNIDWAALGYGPQQPQQQQPMPEQVGG